MFTDKYGNEVERKYQDYFKPLSAFQLAQAFPKEQQLAKNRLRQLRKNLDIYKIKIGNIMKDNIPDDDKFVSIAFLKAFMKCDKDFKEAEMLYKYLKLCPTTPVINKEPVKTEPLKVEQAKQFLLQELFDLQKPRETSSTITCCCPFHYERTPSFVIYKKSNKFHCFSCGEGGDSIHFMMKLYNIDFKSAVRRLS